MLSDFGDVTALEMAPEARAIARKRWGRQVLDGSLPEPLPSIDPDFDLVVMLDVLEHVEADGESLVRVAGLLKPGGHLLITVPAFSFLWSNHDVFHHHFRRYRRRPLRRLVEGAGYDVLRTTYFNTLPFPLIAGVRMVGRLTGARPPETRLSLPRPVMNRALRAVFSSERFLVSRIALPFGVSLLVLARRRP